MKEKRNPRRRKQSRVEKKGGRRLGGTAAQEAQNREKGITGKAAALGPSVYKVL